MAGFEGLVEPVEQGLEVVVFFLEGGEVTPVEVMACGADGDALWFEEGLQGFEFASGHAADAFWAWEFIEEGEVYAEAGDADAVLVAEGAEHVYEGFVVDFFSDE